MLFICFRPIFGIHRGQARRTPLAAAAVGTINEACLDALSRKKYDFLEIVGDYREELEVALCEGRRVENDTTCWSEEMDEGWKELHESMSDELESDHS